MSNPEQDRRDDRVEAGSPARRRIDRLLMALDRLILGIFFRRIEVVGSERLPADGPMVVVANHVNGMVDPLLIVSALAVPAPAARAGNVRSSQSPRLPPRLPRFLAKHTLWRNPVLRPWLILAGVIPIYRRSDAGGEGSGPVDPARNADAFARCHEVLAAGGAIALFPEGLSHSQPALAPLKTGAARIVLEAERKFPGLGTRIVPVGLTFDAKGTFRSRALVQLGEPIDPAPEVAISAARPAGDAAAAHALTARIDRGLQEVTLNYGSWDEARLIGRAAEVFSRGADSADGSDRANGSDRAELRGAGRLAARFSLHRAFIEGYAELRRRFPERTAAAAAAVERYDRLLAAFGLRDEQVAAAYPLSPVVRFAGRTVLRLLLYLPLAALGTLLNWPTYRLVGAIAGRATREPDMPATYKVFGGLVLFPLTWVVEAVAAGRNAGPWAALAVLILAPVSGYVALRFDDRRASFWREARAYLVLHGRRRLAAELESRREEAARAVAELAALADPRRAAGSAEVAPPTAARADPGAVEK